MARPLDGKHLAFDWKQGQLGQQASAPGSAGQHGPLARQPVFLGVGAPEAHPSQSRPALLCRPRWLLGLREQFQHFTAFLKGHSPGDTGGLQGAHQFAAVVDLAVLGKQQAGLPGGGNARYLLLQPRAIQGQAPGRCGVAIPFGVAGKGHDNAAGLEAATQTAVRLDGRDPGGDQLQAALAQGQQRTLQPLGVGGQHAGCDKARRLAAAATQHVNRLSTASQPMGNGQPQQASAQNQDGFLSLAGHWSGISDWQTPAPCGEPKAGPDLPDQSPLRRPSSFCLGPSTAAGRGGVRHRCWQGLAG